MAPISNVRLAVVAIGCALALLAPARAAGQALEELRDDVRTSDPPAPPRAKSPPSHSQPDDPFDPNSSDDVWGSLILFGLVAPFVGPPWAIGDSYCESGYFAHFPYQHDNGYMIIGPALAEGQLYNWAVRGRAEYGTDFHHLDWVGGHLLAETYTRLGFDTDFRHIREDVPPGRFDSLWLGDANVVFRFAQSEYLVMRTGLGVNWLSDPKDTNTGFNFTYGGDFFPIRPWIFSGEIDLGTLGHATLVHFRTTLGVNLGPAEAYLGYDFYDIGPTQIAGLVAGIRLWY